MTDLHSESPGPEPADIGVPARSTEFRTRALNRLRELQARRAGKTTDDPVADAKAIINTAGKPKSQYEVTDSKVLAAAYVLARAKADADGRFVLRSYRESWFEWKGGRYVEIPDGDVFSAAWAAAEEWAEVAARSRSERTKVPITKDRIANALEALKAWPGVRVPAGVQAPCWLTTDMCEPAADIMAFPNGNLNLRKFFAGDKEAFTNPTPDLFTLTAFPYKYDSAATCETWERVSLHNFQSEEMVAAWEEVLGLLLTPDTSHQKAFVLFGPPGTGKSVALAALLALLGPENVSALGLERFKAEYDLANTEGKLANATGDQGDAKLTPEAEGQLKQFICGEVMQVNRKYKQPYTLRPTARLIIAANQGLKFSDKSGAMLDRFQIFPLTVRSRGEGNQDKRLTEHAFWAAEAPGMLNRALEGLRRVQHNKGVSEPPVCRRAAVEFWQEGDPALQFIARHFRENTEGHADKRAVYEAYATFAREHGVKCPLRENSFAKLLRSQFRQMNPDKRLTEGNRPRVYGGVEFVLEGID